MKKVIALVLLLCLMAFVLCGCGDDEEETSSGEVSTVSTLPTVTPTATPAANAKAVQVNATSGLNIRAEASVEGEILGLAPDGSKLPLLIETELDGWYQVEYKGAMAYVSADYATVVEVTLEEYNALREGTTTESSDPAETADDPQGGDDPQAGGDDPQAADDPEAGNTGGDTPPETSEDSQDDSEDGE